MNDERVRDWREPATKRPDPVEQGHAQSQELESLSFPHESPRGYVVKGEGGYWTRDDRIGPLRDARVWPSWLPAYDFARSRPGVVYSLGLAFQVESEGVGAREGRG